jgi:mannose-6-phosphate isomerase-like protein (cupin superfamily)
MASPYTHKNLTEVDDSGPQFGAEGRAEIRFAGEAFDAENTGFTYHRLEPDVHAGFGHRHQNAEEVYVVLSGGGRVKLDDDIVELGRLDTIRVSPEVWRAFSAGPEGLELIVFGPRHDSDGEVDPNWWPAE